MVFEEVIESIEGRACKGIVENAVPRKSLFSSHRTMEDAVPRNCCSSHEIMGILLPEETGALFLEPWYVWHRGCYK